MDYYFKVIEAQDVSIPNKFTKQTELLVLKVKLINNEDLIYRDYLGFEFKYDNENQTLSNKQFKFIVFKVIPLDKDGELRFRQCLMQKKLKQIEQTIRDGLGYYNDFDDSNETILNGFDLLLSEYQESKDLFLEIYDPKNELNNKNSHLIFPKKFL